jgi:multicomponent Na+:H+ antiporter subunit B
VGRHEQRPSHRPLLPLLVVAVTGAALVYGTLDMPFFADPAAPVHQHVVPYYLGKSPEQTGIPNVVTSILASYRGYDTLGELAVIFTAGIGVLALLGLRRRKQPGKEHPTS